MTLTSEKTVKEKNELECIMAVYYSLAYVFVPLDFNPRAISKMETNAFNPLIEYRNKQKEYKEFMQ